MESVTPTKARLPAASQQSVGAELRDSVLLLGLSLTVTVAVAAVAQTAFALLG